MSPSVCLTRNLINFCIYVDNGIRIINDSNRGHHDRVKMRMIILCNFHKTDTNILFGKNVVQCVKKVYRVKVASTAICTPDKWTTTKYFKLINLVRRRCSKYQDLVWHYWKSFFQSNMISARIRKVRVRGTWQWRRGVHSFVFDREIYSYVCRLYICTLCIIYSKLIYQKHI